MCWLTHKPLRCAARWDGPYLMATNQVTGEFLTPEEIREITAYVKTYREVTEQFDVAVNGELPASPRQRAKILHQYSEAGATWWVELEAPGHSFEAYREHIRQGLLGMNLDIAGSKVAGGTINNWTM